MRNSNVSEHPPKKSSLHTVKDIHADLLNLVLKIPITYFKIAFSLICKECIKYFRMYRMIRYHTDKLAGGVGGTETARNRIEMQDRTCRSCELW